MEKSWYRKIPLGNEDIPYEVHYHKQFFKRFYLFIFEQRGKEGEREGEKHQCVVASGKIPSRDLARNPGMCPDWESNQ